MGSQPMNALLLNQAASPLSCPCSRAFGAGRSPELGGHDQVPQNLLIQSLGRGVVGPRELGHLGTTTHYVVFSVWNSQGPFLRPLLLSVSYLCCNKPLQKSAHEYAGRPSSSGLDLADLDQLAQHLWSAGRSADHWFRMASLSLARGWMSTMVMETPESCVSSFSRLPWNLPTLKCPELALPSHIF